MKSPPRANPIAKPQSPLPSTQAGILHPEDVIGGEGTVGDVGLLPSGVNCRRVSFKDTPLLRVQLQLEQVGQVIEKYGGDDGARTRDLRRDRPAF